MQVKLLKELVVELSGPENEIIVDILFNKKDVNEFLIAKKMNLTINQVRNILYKLSAHGLVSFIRKKDNRKGWYIYYWTLDTLKCMLEIEAKLRKDIEELKHKLNEREMERFYVCKPCNIEVREDSALEHDYACQECAETYALVDNTNFVRDIKGRITRKEKEYQAIDAEVQGLKDKKSKEIKRTNEIAAQKRKEENAAKRAAKKAEKEKLAKPSKKSEKKKVVKKVEKKVVKKKK
jgi:transcription initiation factor TFIIE subunit alpha